MNTAGLTFPNRARSYDALRQRIRFLAYDGMFEVPFFVEVDAIQRRGSSQTQSESQYLAAFDAARGDITDVAKEVYSRGGKTMYVLTAADFR